MSEKQEPAQLGVLAGAKESVKDLFRLSNRITTIDENGKEVIEYQPMQKPVNPFKLLAMVSAKGESSTKLEVTVGSLAMRGRFQRL